MAASPYWKVYTDTNEYIAACWYTHDAAAICAARGEGTQVRSGHAKKHTVWTEGVDGYCSESYDAIHFKLEQEKPR